RTAFSESMRHVARITKTTTGTMKADIKSTEDQTRKSTKTMIAAWRDLNHGIRRHLRFITTEMVFLQLDVGHLGQLLHRLSIISAGAFAGMAASAVTFEDAFANVRKTVDASEAEYSRLEKNLREMS